MVEQGAAAIKAEEYATDDNEAFVVYKNRAREENLPDPEINDSFEWCSLSEWNEMKDNPKYKMFEYVSTHQPRE